MAFREVGMIEVKEVLRQWMSGTAKKKIARQVGVDVKTARRYIEAGSKAVWWTPLSRQFLGSFESGLGSRF